MIKIVTDGIHIIYAILRDKTLCMNGIIENAKNAILGIILPMIIFIICNKKDKTFVLKKHNVLELLPITLSFLSLYLYHSTILLKILYLFHYLTEYFGAILWRITVFNQANFNIKLELVTYNLIVKPVCKRRFCINNLFDFLC